MGSYKGSVEIPVECNMEDLFDRLIAQIMNTQYISPLDDLEQIKEDFNDHIESLKERVKEREWILGIKKKTN